MTIMPPSTEASPLKLKSATSSRAKLGARMATSISGQNAMHVHLRAGVARGSLVQGRSHAGRRQRQLRLPVTSCRASAVFLYTRFQGLRKVSIDPFLQRMSTQVRQVRLKDTELTMMHSRAQSGPGPSQHAQPLEDAESPAGGAPDLPITQRLKDGFVFVIQDLSSPERRRKRLQAAEYGCE